MIFDYYNIICPECNHRLIYDIKKDEYFYISECICNLVYIFIDKFNALHLFFNKEEIISYHHSDEEYIINAEIHGCLSIDRQHRLIGFKDIIYSFDEAFGCVSNMFNLALKIKIKLENNLLFI